MAGAIPLTRRIGACCTFAEAGDGIDFAIRLHLGVADLAFGGECPRVDMPFRGGIEFLRSIPFSEAKDVRMMAMSELPLLANGRQEIDIIEKRIREVAQSSQPMHIVEAGCGRHWPIKLSGVQYEITGVDLDETALSLRRKKHNDIDNIVIGDLRSVALDKESYDVVYSAFVLEHIQDAEVALKNLFSWLKPGGILVLRIPDRNTVYGFITRTTPLWVHVFFTKYIARYRNAGEPGHGPYPTYYDKVVSRDGINDYCRRNNIRVLEEHGVNAYLRSSGLVYPLIKLFVRAISAMSLGALPWRYNNLVYVLEKS